MSIPGNKFRKSAEYISSRAGTAAKTAVVLGSGLGGLARALKDAVRIPYGDIPCFPMATNKSHEGVLYAGTLAGRPCLVFSGRLHYYEGLSFEEAAYPVRVMKLLGVHSVVFTNAAGCLNTAFAPGELMLITDHLNFSGQSPCRGENDDAFGPRFFDMTDAYSRELRAVALAQAAKAGIPLREGIYAYMTGPQYETPAEIRALRLLGADAVGMSTVPEVIEAAHCGLKALAVSCLTNYAAGITDEPLSDDEVVKTASKSALEMEKLVAAVLGAAG